MINWLSAIILGPPIVALILTTLLFAFFNGSGLLFGFDQTARVCSGLRKNTMTRFERIFFPIAPYACQEDAGLLQPASKNTIDWLNEVPQPSEKDR